MSLKNKTVGTWLTFFGGPLGLHRFYLNGRTWVAGDALSLADLALAAPLMHAQTARLPLDGLPHLAAWAARVQALPAWQQTEG